MTTININLRIILQSLILVMTFGTILRGYTGALYGVLELFFILIILSLSIFYYADKNKEYNLDYSSYWYLAFLLYLILHLVVATIMRSIDYSEDVEFYSFILAGLFEFKVSSFTYLFPLMYFVINEENQKKFESFLLIIFKITIMYTIFEQFLSLLGFREFFLSYMQGVIYEIHNAYSTRLGMYRVFGLIGSPHILGVLHVIGLIYTLHQKQRIWAFLSFIAVIFSTSITAYGVLIGLFGLYLLYTRNYIAILLSSLLAAILIIIMFQRLEYIRGISHLAEYADASAFDLFVHQIYGYYQLIANVIDPVTYINLEIGPLNLVYNYYAQNPESLILGKGITYTFDPRHYDLVQIHNYKIFTDLFTRVSNDFYFINIFEQFGILGILLLFINFFICPLKKMNKNNMRHVYILNAFLIATLHYSPAESFMFMMFASYSVYALFFMPQGEKSNE